MMDRDLSRTTLESFLLSIASLRRTDLRPMLGQIKVPCDGDVWRPRCDCPSKAMAADAKGIAHAQIERFPSCGHFLMLEEPQNLARNSRLFWIKTVPQQSSTFMTPHDHESLFLSQIGWGGSSFCHGRGDGAEWGQCCS